MNDFGLLVGQYNSALPTLSDGQLSELQLDSSGRLIISGRYLEDAAHSSGDAGIFVMAVRNDSEGSLVDTDGDYAPLQVDSSGRLRVVADLEVTNSHEKAEDSAHSDTDIGSYVLAVRADTRPTNSNVSADGDYASFFINDSGELYVKDTDALTKLTEIDTVLDNIYIDTQAMVVDLAAIETELLDQGTTLDNIETSIDNIEADIDSLTHLEDAAHSSGDAGIQSLAVRNDTLASLVDTDGDYAPFQVDADGALYISDRDRKAEDSAHSSGDYGFMPLAVRNDTAGSLVDTDGDYAPFQVDASGNLRVTFVPVGSEQYTVTDALAAAGDALETITAAGTPWVDVATFAHTSGTAYLYGYQWACDQNAQMRIITDDTADIIVYKTDINSSAMPGTSESWSDGGRIEIAGAANLDIKMQIKKRSATGGNGNGSGSLHIRK